MKNRRVSISFDDFRSIREKLNKGSLLENGLAMQLIKKQIKLNFWRDKKNEIDFVISLSNGRTVAIEVKSYLKNLKPPALKVFEESYPDISIYFGYKDVDKRLNDSIVTCPIYLF